uniref:hypothetical protein n=1 Tax=Aeromonas salmonicida TaxID=645 RepID=UPI00215AC7FE|nr:hypothetical protein [Aeromonas salmonicida]
MKRFTHDADLRGMVVLRSLGFQLVPFKLQGGLTKYDLMKVALAHHRFGWITRSRMETADSAPVDLRLADQIWLQRQRWWRVLNPTAVFAMIVTAITECCPQQMRARGRARNMCITSWMGSWLN